MHNKGLARASPEMAETRHLFRNCILYKIPMAIEDDYREFINAPGQGTAPSYIRAMNITNGALKEDGRFLKQDESLWDIRDEMRLRRLLDIVKQSQNAIDGGIYKNVKTKSYWQKKFCSAALKKFIDFVTTLP